jgi:hypothetical protein
MPDESNGIEELKAAVSELRARVNDTRGFSRVPAETVSLPSEASSWNFVTFEKYVNQRLGDMSLQLRERYEAQQTGVTAALAAAEKAVTAALIAAEKAVDKAEGAQQLRNVAQNEFRQSLADLSKLMWTRLEGSESVSSLRRETTTAVDGLDKKVSLLESGYSNIQGRIWSVGAVWSVIVVAVMIGIQFVHR